MSNSLHKIHHESYFIIKHGGHIISLFGLYIHDEPKPKLQFYLTETPGYTCKVLKQIQTSVYLVINIHTCLIIPLRLIDCTVGENFVFSCIRLKILIGFDRYKRKNRGSILARSLANLTM